MPAHAPEAIETPGSWPCPPIAVNPDGPVEQVFKSDARSRVWLTCVGPRRTPVVLKRFEYAPLRQRLAAWLGLHPAQREVQRTRCWSRRGVPIVPILARGVQGRGLGCRLWLATPYAGPTLLHMIRQGCFDRDHRLARQVNQSLSELLVALIRAQGFFRDLKTSNLVVDERGRVWLIDAGSMRRSGVGRRRHWLRMLAILDRTAQNDGARAVDRLRCLRTVLVQCPQLGSLRQLSKRIGQIMLK